MYQTIRYKVVCIQPETQMARMRQIQPASALQAKLNIS